MEYPRGYGDFSHMRHFIMMKLFPKEDFKDNNLIEFCLGSWHKEAYCKNALALLTMLSLGQLPLNTNLVDAIEHPLKTIEDKFIEKIIFERGTLLQA